MWGALSGGKDGIKQRMILNAVSTLKNENGYVVLETSNDAALPDGPADQIFDRFTTLENSDGTGLGLSYVKDTVKALRGRISANVANGIFTLRIFM